MAVNESCRGTCFEVTGRRLRSIVRLMKSTVGARKNSMCGILPKDPYHGILIFGAVQIDAWVLCDNK
jgi:hypothetical protein